MSLRGAAPLDSAAWGRGSWGPGVPGSPSRMSSSVAWRWRSRFTGPYTAGPNEKRGERFSDHKVTEGTGRGGSAVGPVPALDGARLRVDVTSALRLAPFHGAPMLPLLAAR